MQQQNFLPYIRRGEVAERPHLNLPKDTYEEEIGLEGFYGPVSHLYHLNPPTRWTQIEKASFQWPQKIASDETCLKPQLYKNLKESEGGDFFESKRTMFWNEDLEVSLHRVTEESPLYFRNADASEVYFFHGGSALLESGFGEIKVSAGDYLVIPKGVTYRFKGKDFYILRVESFKSSIKKPETGLLGQQALYHQENITAPTFSIGGSSHPEKTSQVLVQKDQNLTSIEYGFDVRALKGWCGTLYPYAISTSKIAPVMSTMAHLPPSINSTFVATGFVICTFLPRPLEEPEGALKVPFFHSNIDYDEFILYHEGDFFSRDNMEKGYMSLHPRGVNHGPHPKALKNQGIKKRTDEIAVMIDSEKTFKVSKFARSLEDPNYWKSWMEKSGD